MTQPQRVGKYLLLRELGRGGFGSVYEALQEDLGRRVALKFLQSDHPEDVQRFIREAQTAASLTHPDIVHVHEIGEADGRPYIAMELVSGQTLARLRVGDREAAAALRDAALAVHAAHEAGVIHRDLKPHNLMRDDSGRIRVMDFGLARQVRGGATLTTSGLIVGTPAYMPPEQARGAVHSLDRRADVYSLGATLYELLTGRPPFEGASPMDVALRVLGDDPAPPRAVRPSIPAELQTIVQKAMEKEPEKRYSTARAFAEDLDRFLNGEAILAHPPSLAYRIRKTLSRHLALTGTLAALALSTLAAFAYFLGPSWVVAHGERRLAWPAGRHEFDLARDGFDAQRVRVTTQPWRTAIWSTPLVPDHGFLEVRATPPGAEMAVVVADRVVARGPADGSALRVPKGMAGLRITLADHVPIIEPVYLPPGETVRLERALAHETGVVSISAAQQGIRMTLAGRTIHLPAEDVILPTGSFVGLLEKESHFARRVRVTVARGAPAPGPAPAGPGLEWARMPGHGRVHASVEPIARWTHPVTDPVSVPVPAEVTGDGILDIACLVGTTLRVVSGRTGDTVYEVPLAGKDPRLCRQSGDCDADGVADFAALAGARLVLISGQEGRVAWSVPLDGAPSELLMTDADLDGAPDCVVMTSEGVAAFSGRTGGGLWTRGDGLHADVRAGTADLDGDGVRDLIGHTMPGPDTQVVAVSGRDGRTLWTGRPMAATIFSASRMADVDGDGTVDVMIGWGPFLAVLDGRRGRELWRRDLGTTLGAVEAADWDGDGAVEILHGSEGGRLTALAGRTGEPAWTLELGEDVALVIAAADLDGDRRPEVIVSRTNRLVAVGRSGVLWTCEGIAAEDFVVADFEEDGTPDLAVCGRRALVALRGAPSRELWRAAPSSFAACIGAADLDGDGTADAIVSDGPAILALSGVDGAGLWRHRVELTAVEARAELADLDRDGVPDVIYCIWSPASGAASGDLDGDGVPDGVFLAAEEVERPTRVTACAGTDGRVLWTAPIEKDTGRAVFTPALADLDGDGRGDVVVRSGRRRIQALRGADGRELWRVEGAEPLRAGPVAGPFGEGGAVEVLALRSAGAGSSLVRVSVDGRERDSIALGPLVADCLGLPGDVTGDGRPEILLHHRQGIFVIDLEKRKLAWMLLQASTDLRPVSIGDLDGDGVPEVVSERALWMGIHSAKDGACLGEFPDVLSMTSGGDRLFLTGGESERVRAVRFVRTRPPPERLRQLGLWNDLLAAVREAGTDRGRLAARGLAKLRTGDAAGAEADLKEAIRLGLVTADLEALRLEARYAARTMTPAELASAGEEVVALFLARVALTAAQRQILGKHADESPHRLLLAGRAQEALQRLEGREATPAVLALRALCCRELRDLAGESAAHDEARARFPRNRTLRLVREALGLERGALPPE